MHCLHNTLSEVLIIVGKVPSLEVDSSEGDDDDDENSKESTDLTL